MILLLSTYKSKLFECMLVRYGGRLSLYGLFSYPDFVTKKLGRETSQCTYDGKS